MLRLASGHSWSKRVGISSAYTFDLSQEKLPRIEFDSPGPISGSSANPRAECSINATWLNGLDFQNVFFPYIVALLYSKVKFFMNTCPSVKLSYSIAEFDRKVHLNSILSFKNISEL